MGRKFSIWILSFLALCGIYGAFTHIYLSENPKKIVIAVDTSINMKKNADAITEKIRSILKTPYSQFTLITDKSKLVSSDPGTLSSTELKFYGPLNIEGLSDPSSHPELKQASVIYILVEEGVKNEVLKRLPGAILIEFN